MPIRHPERSEAEPKGLSSSAAENRSLDFASLRSGRRGVLAGALALAATHRAAWAQGTSGGTPKKGGVLKVSAPPNPSSLDPATGGSGQDHAFLYPIFDTLVEFDFPTLKTLPG